MRNMKEVPAYLQKRSGQVLRWHPNHHSPVLAAYCRLPRFLKGDRGLPLAPEVVPVGMLVDMLSGSAQRGWIDWELCESSEDGVSEGQRRQGEGGVEEGRRKMQHRCWELQGGCCSQLAYVRACVLRDYEQGFPD